MSRMLPGILAAIVLVTAGFVSGIRIAAADGDAPVKIGVLNDQSGIYADLSGPGSTEAARMAIEDFGGKALGKPIELVAADHQNKADVGAAIARTWYDQDGVDMTVDFSNSSVALAVQVLTKDKQKVTLITAASAAITGKACTPNSAQWVYNSHSNGYSLARVLTERGLKSWFLVTVDYAFGQSFAADIRKAVTDAGGAVIGEVRHPLNTPDLSSFLLQAQSAKPQAIAFASAGSDMTTAIKQAGEFGIAQQAALVAPIVFITDVNAMGLKAAQGLQFITAFYWDRNDESRAWAKRFYERRKVMPTMTQAGVYSAVLHYLKAVEAAKTKDAAAVMTKMRELPVNDAFTHGGSLREDGQLMHDMYLVEVKKPGQSTGPWDYYTILETIPAAKLFQPLSDSDCPLVKK